MIAGPWYDVRLDQYGQAYLVPVDWKGDEIENPTPQSVQPVEERAKTPAESDTTPREATP